MVNDVEKKMPLQKNCYTAEEPTQNFEKTPPSIQVDKKFRHHDMWVEEKTTEKLPLHYFFFIDFCWPHFQYLKNVLTTDIFFPDVIVLCVDDA